MNLLKFLIQLSRPTIQAYQSFEQDIQSNSFIFLKNIFKGQDITELLIKLRT